MCWYMITMIQFQNTTAYPLTNVVKKRISLILALKFLQVSLYVYYVHLFCGENEAIYYNITQASDQLKQQALDQENQMEW